MIHRISAQPLHLSWVLHSQYTAFPFSYFWKFKSNWNVRNSSITFLTPMKRYFRTRKRLRNMLILNRQYDHACACESAHLLPVPLLNIPRWKMLLSKPAGRGIPVNRGRFVFDVQFRLCQFLFIGFLCWSSTIRRNDQSVASIVACPSKSISSVPSSQQIY